MKKNILILYPGFLHYRKGILDELTNSSQHNSTFAGDINGFNSIKPHQFNDTVNFINIPFYGSGILKFSKGILKLAVTKKYDGVIVHAAPTWVTITLAAFIFKIRGVKVYHWTHGLLNTNNAFKNWFYVIYQRLNFSGLLTYGNGAAKNLIKLGYPKKHIKVIYNSLDYKNQIQFRGTQSQSERQELRSSFFKNPDYFQLFFIGRLTPQKKLDMLIKGIQVLKQKGFPANLLFVGGGDEKDKLLAQAKSLGIEENVSFYGPSYDEATNYKLIASSDCCVAPGEIGLTAMHSLMYGVPTISHSDANYQMPEFEAIIPMENGILFEKDNVEDMADKIITLSKNLSHKTPQEIQDNCYHIIDTYFNPTYQLNLIENLF